jgi:ferredoxin
MTYAYPRVSDMGLRLKTLLQAYRGAGGEDACLLFHGGGEGRELIARLARRGRGLPARVIPLELLHIASLGLDLMLGSVALGAGQLVILASGTEPPGYLRALERQMGYAQEILTGLGLGEDRFRLIEARDPAALERSLWTVDAPRALAPAPFNLSTEKRVTLDFIFDHLLRQAPARKPQVAMSVPLSSGAPYGQVVVDKQKCTMCLACVGACPEGALLDAKDKPQLKFIERNCVQCGLCEKTCPENAISLVPRLLLAPEATQPVVVNEDRIFACVRCGKEFANQRIIDDMVGRLAAHSMFRDPAALKRLQMCQDCRVIDMFEKGGDGTIFDGARDT